jgi:hypothetical protein
MKLRYDLAQRLKESDVALRLVAQMVRKAMSEGVAGAQSIFSE